jgi:deoxyadenosine/deoxycytidine kinase
MRARPDEMVTFLRETVGMRSRTHAAALAAALEQMNDEAAADAADKAGASGFGKRERLTICVEGNISAGKTTFLQSIISNSASLGQRVQVVPEPVDRWTAIPSLDAGGAGAMPRGADASADEYNILGAFYKDPARWGYTFQNWVFFTRFMQERNSSLESDAFFARSAAAAAAGAAGPAFRLMERSVFSDRLVFVEALQETSQLSGMEMAIYRNWFEFMMVDKPQLVPDAFIYLRASAETCHGRMQRRARAEEGGVPLDYLRMLHRKHEGWFLGHEGVMINAEKGGCVVNQRDELARLVAQYPGIPDLRRTAGSVRDEFVDHMTALVPSSIRGAVVFLPAAGASRPLHERAMARIPALVLDCDGSLDVARDIGARDAYAAQVSDFYDYVSTLHKTVFPLFGGPGREAEQGKAGGRAEKVVNAAEMRRLLEELEAAVEKARGGVLLTGR